MNCGPRKRFVVMDQHGQPLIVHNCENIVQATANDILRQALRGLDAAGIDVVLHVHDEIVAEVDTEKADELAVRMKAVMVTSPAWAEGLPLGASGKVLARYGKA